jgi:hypothetical protein
MRKTVQAYTGSSRERLIRFDQDITVYRNICQSESQWDTCPLLDSQWYLVRALELTEKKTARPGGTGRSVRALTCRYTVIRMRAGRPDPSGRGGGARDDGEWSCSWRARQEIGWDRQLVAARAPLAGPSRVLHDAQAARLGTR